MSFRAIDNALTERLWEIAYAESPEVTDTDEESEASDVLESWENGDDKYSFGEYLAEVWLEKIRKQFKDNKVSGSVINGIYEAADKMVSGWDDDNWQNWRERNGRGEA